MMTNETIKAIKYVCMAIWCTYNDDFLYATDKINFLTKSELMEANIDFWLGMFDKFNQAKALEALSYILDASENIKLENYISKLKGN